MSRRAQRDRRQAFLVEGTVAVEELLGSGAEVETLFVSVEAGAEATALAEQARDRGVAVVWVSAGVARSLSSTSTPQGIVAVARLPAPAPLDFGAADLVVVLAEVRDPGNAGTLVRSAVAAGAGAAVFSERSVDPYGPKTIRAAAGATFGLGIWRDVRLEDAAAALHSHGFVLLGADPAAPKAHTEVDMTRKVAFVLGNEAWGLPPGTQRLLDDVVHVPMPGPAESLNVAIAGAILMFEAVRQRGAGLSSSLL